MKDAMNGFHTSSKYFRLKIVIFYHVFVIKTMTSDFGNKEFVLETWNAIECEISIPSQKLRRLFDSIFKPQTNAKCNRSAYL